MTENAGMIYGMYTMINRVYGPKPRSSGGNTFIYPTGLGAYSSAKPYSLATS